MTTLSRSDFPEFFTAVNGGSAPFAWQQRLFDHIVDHGCWPSQIAAPTGSGKSSVVEIHVMAVALSAVGEAPRLPRRLATVVGRRALVDSQADRAEAVAAWIASDEPIAVAMRAALHALIGGVGDPLQILHLRGGLPSSRDWVDEPRACTIICATPDMFGSRLLFRGYGSGRRARPREAGLMATDTVLVLDEAHLNRQLLATTRRVSELGADAAAEIGVPGLQVVETTATPDVVGADDCVGVVDDDLAVDDVLRARLGRPKPVRYQVIPSWSGKKQPVLYVSALADVVRDVRAEVAGGTVCCVVNNVATAIRVAKDLNAPCWVGRLRPYDLDQLRDRHPSLFGLRGRGDTEVPPIVVATQTIEVGVDADFVGMVTELAPGSAIAQRAGRVNRRGERDFGPVVVVGPENDQLADQLPYRVDDLRSACRWLRSLEREHGLSPQSISRNPPPGARAERPLIKWPQPYDVDRWVQTTDGLLIEEDLELWLRDSLDPDEVSAGIVVRNHMPDDDTVALNLLRATPPMAREVFPVTVALAREHIQAIVSGRGERARAFVERDGDISPVDGADPRVRPGDVFVVDQGHVLTESGVVTRDPGEEPQAVPNDERVVVLPGGMEDEWLTRLAGLSAWEAQQLVDESSLAMQVTLPSVTDSVSLPWVVFTRITSVADDEELREEWTRSAEVVTLERHQHAVAKRARALGEELRIAPALCDVLSAAGLHHDDGKNDRRFQRERLSNREDPPLAKSRVRSGQQVRRNRASGLLPAGWRHEMLSVVLGWDELQQCADPELAVRLVGTSHGHGRAIPPNNAAELVVDQPRAVRDRAIRLFDEGDWVELVERTTRRWGPWGSAYLEAILRAADCQVSKEGS